MLTMAEERSHLELADRHLQDARRRIRSQIGHVRRKRGAALDEELSVKLLRTFLAIQRNMRIHRAAICGELLGRLQVSDRRMF